jgi:hypothetical protein
MNHERTRSSRYWPVQTKRALLKRLDPLARKQATVAGFAVKGAVWTRPELRAEVAYRGFTTTGELRAAGGFVAEQESRAVLRFPSPKFGRTLTSCLPKAKIELHPFGKPLILLVGATGIEPVTPTMSR